MEFRYKLRLAHWVLGPERWGGQGPAAANSILGPGEGLACWGRMTGKGEWCRGRSRGRGLGEG